MCIRDRSIVYHVGGATLNAESPRKTFLNFRNSLLMLYKNSREADLKHVMRIRFWLDYIAAAKFLMEGHIQNAKAVYEARKAYHQLKPEYAPKRKENLEKSTLSTKMCIRDSVPLGVGFLSMYLVASSIPRK